MTVFEARSYRTDCRFGARVSIAVADDTVTVTGPQVGRLIYRLWTAGQGIL